MPEKIYYDASRGVYTIPSDIGERKIYFAISSDGELLETLLPRRGETDAEVIVALAYAGFRASFL